MPELTVSGVHSNAVKLELRNKKCYYNFPISVTVAEIYFNVSNFLQVRK